jgi:hypothetical protein
VGRRQGGWVLKVGNRGALERECGVLRALRAGGVQHVTQCRDSWACGGQQGGQVMRGYKDGGSRA